MLIVNAYNTKTVDVRGIVADHHKHILTDGALCFIRDLVHEFAYERHELLEALSLIHI